MNLVEAIQNENSGEIIFYLTLVSSYKLFLGKPYLLVEGKFCKATTLNSMDSRKRLFSRMKYYPFNMFDLYEYKNIC